VTPDLDTLLTALYVEIDDHVVPSARPRPGQPKKLTDAELVCLAVAQVLLGARSEHHWLRLCYARLGHLFPYLPNQPGYHKRLKAAGPLLAAAMDHLARQCPSVPSSSMRPASAWALRPRLSRSPPLLSRLARLTTSGSRLAVSPPGRSAADSSGGAQQFPCGPPWNASQVSPLASFLVTEPVYVGNAAADAPGNRGWLLGHFRPSVDARHSDDVEVKWGSHPAGDQRPEWVAGERRSALVLLISGRLRVELPGRSVVLAEQGDYVVFHGISHSWYAEEASVVVVVRWPSIRGYAAPDEGRQ
jgi:hypothetical protein